MSYTTKEQWQSLYEDPQISELRKIAIDKLNEPGNQVHPGTKNAAKEIWNLCVMVAEKLGQSQHTVVRTGRDFKTGYGGHALFNISDSSVVDQSIVVKKTDLGGETEISFTLRDFESLLDLYKHRTANYVNVIPLKGGNRNMINFSHVLPMCSLGVFQASGKNWIDIEELSTRKGMPKDFENYYTGRPRKDDIGHASSLTGHFENYNEMKRIGDSNKETENQIYEIVELLELRKNVILEGVPGTGKTWLRNKVKEKMDATLETTTFHPAKTYEEFIGGIFPKNENGKLHFNYVPGTLSNVANQAMNDKSGKKYILFIDEINRANIPMVMGELLTIIESTKRVSPDGNDALTNKPTGNSTWEVAVHTEPDLTKYLRLPDNLYILATMNTSDRSVVSMDAALRRRFAYFRVKTMLVTASMDLVNKIIRNTKPDEDQYFWKSRNLLDKGGLFERVFVVLADINQNILQKKVGPDAMLGHSYLFVTEEEVRGLSNEEAVSEILQLTILPQIADNLTSLNKTDSEIVNEINSKLKPLSIIGASNYILREPVESKHSLDIAVTVIENKDKLFDDPELLFDNDDLVFRYADAYIKHLERGEVMVLPGSKLRPQTPEARNGDVKAVTGLIEQGVIVEPENGSRYFAKEHQFSTASRIGRIINGRESHEGPSAWKNKNNVSLRDYFSDVSELQMRED